MSNINGGSAFPRAASIYPNGIALKNGGAQEGMSLRDYFAAKALAALILKDKDDINRGASAVPKMASWAYEYADAMLAERAK